MKFFALNSLLTFSVLTLVASVNILDSNAYHKYCQGVVTKLKVYGISLDIRACGHIDIRRLHIDIFRPIRHDCKTLVQSANILGLRCDEIQCDKSRLGHGNGRHITKRAYNLGAGSGKNSHSRGGKDGKDGSHSAGKGGADKDYGVKKGYDSKSALRLSGHGSKDGKSGRGNRHDETGKNDHRKIHEGKGVNDGKVDYNFGVGGGHKHHGRKDYHPTKVGSKNNLHGDRNRKENYDVSVEDIGKHHGKKWHKENHATVVSAHSKKYDVGYKHGKKDDKDGKEASGNSSGRRHEQKDGKDNKRGHNAGTKGFDKHHGKSCKGDYGTNGSGNGHGGKRVDGKGGDSKEDRGKDTHVTLARGGKSAY
ncbi:hypothetical protein K7432_008859 [Basidiobolus ranarum]|uniref:Uncharacterized protein n=1 Tax=Basidiobolus ranarum TaxID=34480 RepID=A0ABR2WR56_9FUNG